MSSSTRRVDGLYNSRVRDASPPSGPTGVVSRGSQSTGCGDVAPLFVEPDRSLDRGVGFRRATAQPLHFREGQLHPCLDVEVLRRRGKIDGTLYERQRFRELAAVCGEARLDGKVDNDRVAIERPRKLTSSQ